MNGGASIFDYSWSSIARVIRISGSATAQIAGSASVEYLDRGAAQEEREKWSGAAAAKRQCKKEPFAGDDIGDERSSLKKGCICDSVVRKGKSRAYRRIRDMPTTLCTPENPLKEGLSVARLNKIGSTALPAKEREKLQLARVIWTKTTVFQPWIATTRNA